MDDVDSTAPIHTARWVLSANMLQTLHSNGRSRLSTIIYTKNNLWSYIVPGVDSVEFTCGGCLSEENSPEYFCSREDRYLYFRCEGSGSSTLTWNISSQHVYAAVPLGSLSMEENTIQQGFYTVYIDTVDFTNGRSHIISYLWFNLKSLGSDVNVSCSNGGQNMKTLKKLGNIIECIHCYLATSN